MVCEQTSNYNLNLDALGLHLYSANFFAHDVDLGVVNPIDLSVCHLSNVNDTFLLCRHTQVLFMTQSAAS